MRKLSKNHLRQEYIKMKKREKKILEEHEQFRKENGENKYFLEEEIILKDARRKLNEIKQVL